MTFLVILEGFYLRKMGIVDDVKIVIWLDRVV